MASMWFFTLEHYSWLLFLVIGVLYLLLAAVIPLIVLHYLLVKGLWWNG